MAVILKIAETNTYNSFAVCFFSLFSYVVYASCKIDNDKKKQL